MSPHDTLRRRTDPLIGTVVGGQYRVDAKIGEGGMGAVYRATQLAMHREVALKALRPNVPADEKVQLVERFRREALATSKLRHPNTVSVYDFGETPEGVLYMVLELLQGSTLSQVIRAAAPLPAERVAYIGKQIAKSLAEAHEVGIVHRDLKPDNVFICDYHGDQDFTKVMDFGIARLLTGDENHQVTRTGMMVGTPRYIAPEQAMARKVTPAADLYSLGVILFEMLIGRAPFEADSAMGLAMAHVNDPVPDVIVPGLPEPLNDGWRGLVQALLTKNPKKRPQQAGEIAHWLSQLELDARRFRQEGRGASWTVEVASPSQAPATYEGPSPKATVTVSRATGERRGAVWIAVAAVLFMALGGGLAYFLITLNDPSPPAASPGPALAAERATPSDGSVPTQVAAAPARPPVTRVAATPAAKAPTTTTPAGTARPPATPAPVTHEAPPEPPAKAHLVLSSRPVGATVRRGDDVVCTTPCDLDLAPAAGAVALRLDLTGYKEHLFYVDLLAGETVEETVVLKRVRSAPPVTPPTDGPSLPALRLDTP